MPCRFAAASVDSIQMVKLYPEGNAEARVKRNGVKRIFTATAADCFLWIWLRGLMTKRVVMMIPGKEKIGRSCQDVVWLEIEPK
ncbi:hypothetical protein [Jutongia sp.]|uniref:hypothetical protein n=1 Tax=Jutongia sp. TaxID=2944204 RepID=UPI0030792169